VYYKKVGKNTARNPIARAVAQAKLRSVITNNKIKLYLLGKGESCADMMETIGYALSVIGYAAELDPAIGHDDIRVRVLRGGLSACQQMLLSDSYDPLNTVSIDKALDAAEELNRIIKPEYANQAMLALATIKGKP
jgi:hypothetical protein